MKIKQHIASILAASLTLTIISCGSTAEKKPLETKEEKTAEKEEPKEALELSEEQLKAVGIQLGHIEKKNLNAVIKASGQLEVPPQNKADVNVLIGGIVRKINVLEGQYVKKGQLLVTIENTDLVKMQQDYLTTKNSFAFTQEELTRQKELNEANAGTGKNLQQVQATYNAEKAKILTIEKQLQQIGINPVAVANGNIATQVTVTAPIGGTIGHIWVNTGTYAETTKPLMEIVDNSQVHCDLVVYEKDLFKVKIGQKVNFILTNQNDRQIQGEIYGVNKSFENDSKGIIVHAIIKDAAKFHLIQGMYVTALISIGNQLTPTVPIDAVVRSERKDYIFLLDNAHQEEQATEKEESEEKEKSQEKEGKRFTFKKVEVVTGVTELGYVQITPLEELPTDAQIVTKGSFYLLSKEKATGEEEGE